MISTRATSVLGVDHPVVLAGMSSGFTDAALVAAVSEAGGLGVMGVTDLDPDGVVAAVEGVRALTTRPFGLNLLLFAAEESVDAVLATRPRVFSTAWPSPEHDLREIFGRAHEAGAVVMHMVPTLADAVSAADAGADVIVAQGTEGGGHVGLLASVVIVPQVARAVAPVPVLAAGGFADGAGLAAALALGAEGVLLGTRFLATVEAPVSDGYKQALVSSDGHDAELSGVPDLLAGAIWPGAHGRVLRNRLIERWTAREGQLRARRSELLEQALRARRDGDMEEAVVWAGQSAGLVVDIAPAGAIVQRIVREAETIIRDRAELVTGG
ncbi:MAG TPA: nitronate monooxygenase family protein [Gaiella sp.]|uniref:NAD(P)H-dependent flavin oxidoreductase n=1 Tax=Gaiella sp. TaxID=2663207 RepID=UPI002D7E4CC5|nr:nitronate monooxygenase family protein [Gaiella sp.]HET9289179.1 nitronate monooxygenase family protein [Gaiella sp.]